MSTCGMVRGALGIAYASAASGRSLPDRAVSFPSSSKIYLPNGLGNLHNVWIRFFHSRPQQAHDPLSATCVKPAI